MINRILVLTIVSLMTSLNLSGKNILLTGGFVYHEDGKFLTDTIVLCQDGKITYVGPNEDLPPVNHVQKINLNGGYVLPGFIDSHIHLQGYGRSLEILNLVGTKSVDEIATLVSDAINQKEKGEWIIGRGWDQNDWSETSFPTKDILDRIAPDYPIYLTRIDGHAIWVNSSAMNLTNITLKTPDPEGGKIIRNKYGEPTGVFVDNAIALISDHIPSPSKNQKRKQILHAVKKLNKIGITSIHDAGTDSETLDLLKTLADSGDLTLRVYAMLQDDPDQYLPYFETGPLIGYGNNHLTIRSIKAYIDGALGSRGAVLKEPYADDPENRGLLLSHPEHLDSLVSAAFSHGFQVNIHAIGDRGNQICLDIFEKYLEKYPGDHRPRIEHAQILDPLDIPRFASFGVIPSMQPTHCTSDMPWLESRLGKDRLSGAYAWKSLIDSGSIIPGGSDAPVENPNPLWGIYAAITRMDHTGHPEGGWFPQECVSRIEAFRIFTEWGAYAAFEETIKGKIKEGYLADLVVLDKNILEMPVEEILSTQVLITIVNGRVIHKK